jgi:predicted ArsR family transcriptional regulator
MPVWMIGDRLGISEPDIRRHFARLRNRESRADRAAWLRTAGQSLRQIATALGVSEATVRRDLAARPVRHLPARKSRIVPASAPEIAHQNDAPPAAVVPLRRIAR